MRHLTALATLVAVTLLANIASAENGQISIESMDKLGLTSLKIATDDQGMTVRGKGGMPMLDLGLMIPSQATNNASGEARLPDLSVVPEGARLMLDLGLMIPSQATDNANGTARLPNLSMVPLNVPPVWTGRP